MRQRAGRVRPLLGLGGQWLILGALLVTATVRSVLALPLELFDLRTPLDIGIIGGGERRARGREHEHCAGAECYQREGPPTMGGWGAETHLGRAAGMTKTRHGSHQGCVLPSWTGRADDETTRDG
ncbi:hypothetical protein ASE38_01640 [Cellulomonas sp. Root930]|nr:hypothetical protein ASE38_01640 [Cellulomonas sp. Root930]